MTKPSHAAIASRTSSTRWLSECLERGQGRVIPGPPTPLPPCSDPPTPPHSTPHPVFLPLQPGVLPFQGVGEQAHSLRALPQGPQGPGHPRWRGWLQQRLPAGGRLWWRRLWGPWWPGRWPGWRPQLLQLWQGASWVGPVAPSTLKLPKRGGVCGCSENAALSPVLTPYTPSLPPTHIFFLPHIPGWPHVP